MEQQQTKIYLDNAAGTPVDENVYKKMNPYFTREFHNPGALYREGVSKKNVINQARAELAKILDCRDREVVFVNGGTESDSMALQGVVSAWHREHTGTPHIIVSAIEHSAVLATARLLERRGQVTVTELTVDTDGIVQMHELEAALAPETILVSIMYANNEIGVVEPITEIAKTIRTFKKKTFDDRKAVYPLLHTDAIQAINYLPIGVPQLGVDLMSLSAAKTYGPKGIGALYVKKGVPIEPIIFGGSQEFGLRPGTENVPAIVGFVEAVRVAQNMREQESERLRTLQEEFFVKLDAYANQVADDDILIINGHREQRLPNNINISVPGVSSEELVLRLDEAGIQCSAKSACKNDDPKESYVIKALRPSRGADDDGERGRGSIRISMGRTTTQQDMEYTFKALVQLITDMRATAHSFAVPEHVTS